MITIHGLPLRNEGRENLGDFKVMKRVYLSAITWLGASNPNQITVIRESIERLKIGAHFVLKNGCVKLVN